GLLTGHCSLMHAPGYCFLMGLPLELPGVRSVMAENRVLYSYLLLIEQHLIDVMVTLVLLVTLSVIFSLLTACICILLYSLNVFGLGITSSCRPEWLQSDLLVLVACTAYFAYRAVNWRRKALLYWLAGFLMALCVIVKPNGIGIGVVIAGLLIIDR